MHLEKHISELLFEHDCVIIPDFGGFVCNYSPANIHEGKSQFHPSFKKISFNRNLKNNDGLLANQIARSENISYSDSNRFISEFAERLNKELSTDKHFGLKNIGTFYLGEEDTLLFEQDNAMNYLPESFGLTAFYSPAIRREPLVKKMGQKFKDKIIIPSNANKDKVEVKRRIPVAGYIAVAASLLIIASLVFISTQTDLLKNVTIANLNPFGEKIQPLYHSSEVVLPEIKNENISNFFASNDSMKYRNIILGGKTPVVVSLMEDKTAVKKTVNVKRQTSNRFHIIGGAFAVSENADKFCKKLLKQGYDATIIDKKFRFVSYGGFTTRNEALQALEKIRAVQSDAWLMKN